MYNLKTVLIYHTLYSCVRRGYTFNWHNLKIGTENAFLQFFSFNIIIVTLFFFLVFIFFDKDNSLLFSCLSYQGGVLYIFEQYIFIFTPSQPYSVEEFLEFDRKITC